MEHLNESGNFDMFKSENKPQPVTPFMYRANSSEQSNNEALYFHNLKSGINKFKKVYLFLGLHYFCIVGVLAVLFALCCTLYNDLASDNFSLSKISALIVNPILFSSIIIIIYLANLGFGIANLVNAINGFSFCEKFDTEISRLKVLFFSQFIISAISSSIESKLDMVGLSLVMFLISLIPGIAFTVKLLQELRRYFDTANRDSVIPSDIPEMISNSLRKFLIFTVCGILLCIAGCISIKSCINNNILEDTFLRSLGIRFAAIAIGFLLPVVSNFIVSHTLGKIEDILPKNVQ